MWVIEEIKNKTAIIYPGCQIPDSSTIINGYPETDSPPLIIWNHRWEFDKGPDEFFEALDEILNQGLDFRLAFLGENFRTLPKSFILAKERYGNKIVQYGYEKSKEKYLDWLKKGAIVISTATQENFGIAVVEAMRYGCLPLLPNRLSYPEILPEEFHKDFLYNNQQDLSRKLSMIITDRLSFREKSQKVSRSMGRYSWKNLIKKYDEELKNLSVK
jgi:glycosyltransferase involved in cell wall biosynthesis